MDQIAAKRAQAARARRLAQSVDGVPRQRLLDFAAELDAEVAALERGSPPPTTPGQTTQVQQQVQQQQQQEDSPDEDKKKD